MTCQLYQPATRDTAMSDTKGLFEAFGPIDGIDVESPRPDVTQRAPELVKCDIVVTLRAAGVSQASGLQPQWPLAVTATCGPLEDAFDLLLQSEDTVGTIRADIFSIRGLHSSSRATLLGQDGKLLPRGTAARAFAHRLNPAHCVAVTLQLQPAPAGQGPLTLAASTLGGNAFDVTVELEERVEAVAARIHQLLDLDADTSVALMSLDGSLLPPRTSMEVGLGLTASEGGLCSDSQDGHRCPPWRFLWLFGW